MWQLGIHIMKAAIITCLQTAFVAVAGDDTNRSGVDTCADETVHVIVDQVFYLQIIKHK